MLVVSNIAMRWLCCKERQQQNRVQLQVLLALTSLSEEEKVRLKHKFDIAYWLAVEKVSFRKFSSICNLETQHGVNIGTSHTTETATKSFTSQAQRNELAVNLQKAKFFSLLLDGSTDAGNVENELLQQFGLEQVKRFTQGLVTCASVGQQQHWVYSLQKFMENLKVHCNTPATFLCRQWSIVLFGGTFFMLQLYQNGLMF